jgi:hypothetical protein
MGLRRPDANKLIIALVINQTAPGKGTGAMGSSEIIGLMSNAYKYES